jgi:DNA polymerase-1
MNPIQLFFIGLVTPWGRIMELKPFTVDSQAALDNVSAFIGSRQISHAGIAFEYSYEKEVVMGNDLHGDIRSIKPVRLSLHVVPFPSETVEAPLSDAEDKKTFVFILAVDKLENLAPLREILNMQVPFVGHNLKTACFCLWQMGLQVPDEVWDTYICERFFSLGLHHKRYLKSKSRGQSYESIQDAADLKLAWEEQCQIQGTAIRYGVVLPFAGHRPWLMDCVGSARVYEHQVDKAAQTGSEQYLKTIEMPWVVTNAQIEWAGINIDHARAKTCKKTVDEKVDSLERIFQQAGLNNPGSNSQLISYFRKLRLLRYFKVEGGMGYSFDKDALKRLRGIHPQIHIIQLYKKLRDLQSSGILSRGAAGSDGRIHPCHVQLGAHTGRQTSTGINVLGVDKLLRNLIIPHEGSGIIEVDWCQVEVGIAGAVYKEPVLVTMYNTGDAYSAMAQRFYADLEPAAREMPTHEFKRMYPTERKLMKTMTLALLYGITKYGIKDMLGVPVSEAQGLIDAFGGMFPDLSANKRKVVAQALKKGHATALHGVARYRKNPNTWPSNWERNWLGNHPVQGTGAVLFKDAGNRLAPVLDKLGARIIIPLHDSFIIETPLEHITPVSEETARIMKETVSSAFPQLKPRVDINNMHPECWNKDGIIDAFEQWITEISGIIEDFTRNSQSRKEKQ